MATTTVHTIPEKEAMSNGQPPKRGRGRPRVHPLPPAIMEDRIPDEFPPEEQGLPQLTNDKDFFEYLTEFSPSEWQNSLIAYLYRTAPQIDLKRLGTASSIQQYVECVDTNKVMLDHGSGGYRIDFCRKPIGGTKQKRLAQHYFTILNPEYPPKVPYGTWIDHPANEMWKWAAPKLQAAERHQEAQASGQDPSTLFKTVFDAVKLLRPTTDREGESIAAKAIESMNAMQQQMLAAADPTKQFAMIKGMLDMLQPKEDSSTKLVLEMMRDELKSTREELSRMRSQPAPSLLDQLREVMPMVKEFRSFMGGSNKQAEGGVWPAVIDKLVDFAGNAMPIVADAIKQRGGAPAAPGSPTIIHARPGLNGPQPAAGTAAPQTTRTEEPMPEAKPDPRIVIQQFLPLITQVAPMLIDHFKRLTGYDFRDWFLETHGSYNWMAMRDQLGIENLVSLAQQHSILKLQLSPPEKLRGFLEEFFTDPAGTGEPDEDPEAGDKEA